MTPTQPPTSNPEFPRKPCRTGPTDRFCQPTAQQSAAVGPVLQAQRLALGLDVSQWQGPNFPFHRAAQAGFTFAYLRATVRTRHDPCYGANRARAIDAGFMTGGYHYLYPTPNPRRQAFEFFNAVRANYERPDQLPPALDVEEDDLTEDHILDFLEAWMQVSNWRHLLIYTSRHKWHNIVGQTAEWPSSFPLWVADWGDLDEPRLPASWDRWAFWQWTSKGHIPGYTGPVDLNYYNGTADQLRNDYPEVWK